MRSFCPPLPGSQMWSSLSVWDGEKPLSEPRCFLHPRCPRRPDTGRAAAHSWGCLALWSKNGVELCGVKTWRPVGVLSNEEKWEIKENRDVKLLHWWYGAEDPSTKVRKEQSPVPHEKLRGQKPLPRPALTGGPKRGQPGGAYCGRRGPQEVSTSGHDFGKSFHLSLWGLVVLPD